MKWQLDTTASLLSCCILFNVTFYLFLIHNVGFLNYNGATHFELQFLRIYPYVNTCFDYLYNFLYMTLIILTLPPPPTHTLFKTFFFYLSFLPSYVITILVKLLFQLRKFTFLFASLVLICLVLYLKKIILLKFVYCIVLSY